MEGSGFDRLSEALDKDITMPRRHFLGLFAAGATLGYLSKHISSGGSEAAPFQIDEVSSYSEATTEPEGEDWQDDAEIIDRPTELTAFSHPEAQAVAEGLAISPDDFFKISREVAVNVRESGAHLSGDLMPVFPPGVSRYKGELEGAAEEFDVPVNVLAALASIESAGNISVRSHADARGLIQVVPRYHMERISRVSGIDVQGSAEAHEVLTNPQMNIRIAADFLHELIDKSRRDNDELDPNSLAIFGRAAAAYNGGPSRVDDPFETLPLESQLYVNHMSRILLDVAVAHGLRERGLGDAEILRAMSSDEMDARAAAYATMSDLRRSLGFEGYEISATLAAQDVPGVAPEMSMEGVDSSKMTEEYIAYLEEPWFSYYAPPGYRIWLSGGGAGLFTSEPTNEAWRR